MSSFDRPYSEGWRERRGRGRRTGQRWGEEERREFGERGEREEDWGREPYESQGPWQRFGDESGRGRDEQGFERYGDLGYDEGRYAQHRERGAEHYARFGGWDRPRTAREPASYGYGPGGVYAGTPSANRGLRQHGRYAGRGPKGYQRSDERVREEVCDHLMADPDIDAAELTVTVRDGEVTLEGSVPERSMKRDAEDCAESISGVRQVHNRLRVEPGEGDERSGGGAAASGAGRYASAGEAQRSSASRKTSL